MSSRQEVKVQTEINPDSDGGESISRQKTKARPCLGDRDWKI